MVKRITALIAFLLIITGAYAQRNVTGKVTDANGEALAGATIQVKGTTKGSIADINGKFQISIDPTDKVLVVSYIGYLNQEVAIGDGNVYNVVLNEDLTSLNEVVVVGYGTQKKSLVTGSISKVDAEQLTINKPTRVEQALQGKTAGVVIQQQSGAPGGGFTVRVRGVGSNSSTDPLYIVDGVKTGGIDYLSPNDIESVEVLKDAASAAIYGAEGANGVVLITTKTGKGNGKGNSEITYNYYRGVQSVAHIAPVLNAKEYVSYMREAYTNDYTAGGPYGAVLSGDKLKKKVDASFPYSPDTIGSGTNWANEIFKTAPIEEHNIQFSGNTEKGWYNISSSYYNQDGIVGGSKSNYERYTFRINADHEVKPWFKVGTRMGYTHKKKHNLSENTEYGGVVSDALQLDPLTPVFFADTNALKAIVKKPENRALALHDENGNYYGISKLVSNEVRNPVAQVANTHDVYSEDKIVGSIFAELKPIENLTLHSQVGLDLAYGTNESWTPTSYYNLNTITTMSSMNQGINRYNKVSFENYASYDFTIADDHAFSVMAGFSSENYHHNYLGGTRYKMLQENEDFNVLSSALIDSTQAASGNKDQTRMASTFGRIGYNFKEKYMFQAQIRRDGTSRLKTGYNYGIFPSFSAGWVITKEDFWPVEQINNLKLRASWGQNGSLQGLNGNFQYVSTISYNAGYSDASGSVLNGAYPAYISNAKLRWETSQQTDIGIDLGLFNNQITATLDYYDKRTIDQLGQDATVPDYSGNTAPYVNSGEVSNKGLEMELGYRKSSGEFHYGVTMNAARLKNEVVSYGKNLFIKDVNFGTSGNCKGYTAGYPAWFIYGYKTAGIFQNQSEVDAYVNDKGEKYQTSAVPGDVKFVDVNKDGKINDDDKTMIGNPYPKWTYGLSFDCDYKGFDFNMFWQGVEGNDILNATYRADLKNTNKPAAFWTERWTGEGTSNKYPRASYTNKNENYKISDLFVEDGSYLRLKSVTLGYTIPQRLTQKLLINKFRVYVSGQNLITFTKYTGTDPEVGGTGASSIGIDKGLYPQARVMMAGVNITF
jgi:TonB-linked SusC/RagA family outer membrane protein